MCHYRHRAHGDPFRWVGLQDITAQVDFSALAGSGVEAGFDLAGYTTQAHFLMASGLQEVMAQVDPEDGDRYMQLAQSVKQLMLPSEMGERFKVLGLSRGDVPPLRGFTMVDLRERL
jgi:SAM-dependent MidA family methyltransferase